MTQWTLHDNIILLMCLFSEGSEIISIPEAGWCKGIVCCLYTCYSKLIDRQMGFLAPFAINHRTPNTNTDYRKRERVPIWERNYKLYTGKFHKSTSLANGCIFFAGYITSWCICFFLFASKQKNLSFLNVEPSIINNCEEL